MQSGKLRHRFTIQKYTDTLNDYGENVPPTNDSDWSTFAQRWGALNPVRGDERDLGDKIATEVAYVIKIRFTAGLLPSMRFKLGSRYFNIEQIRPDRTDERYQEIIAIEKVQ